MERFIRENGVIVGLTKECIDDLAGVIDDVYAWCDCYGECGWEACKMIVEEFFEQKKDLLNTLSKHPNWDDDRMAIIMPQDISRTFDKKSFTGFLDLFDLWAALIIREKEIEVHGYKYEKLMSELQGLKDDVYHLSFLSHYPELDNLRTETIRKRDELLDIKDDVWNHAEWKCTGQAVFLKEDWDKVANARRVFDYLKGNPHQYINKDNENYINELIPGFKAKEGQKVSRVVNKLCTSIGLNGITNKWLSDIGYGYPDYDDDKNMYNIKYSAFADTCNPFSVTKRTFFSLHPIDFLTMSWGTTWSTCMTPDKEDKHRYGSGTGASYRGCYSSGVLSYLMDGSTVVFYTLGDDAEVLQEELKEPTPRKEMRQLFHIGKDKFVQGRLYPYDQTDKGNHAEPEDYVQYRSIVQSILSTCWDIPNLWKPNKRGSDEISPEVSSLGTHYRDYTHYANCNISFAKEYNGSERIVIGHNPICPGCGKSHAYEDNAFCMECRGEDDDHYGQEWCEYHQEWEDDCDMVYIEDYGYVCEAGRDNCDNIRYCDYCNEWFYDRGDSVESERDNRLYCCQRCAERDGYYWNECAEDYLHEDDTSYSEIDNEDLPNFDLDRFGLVWAYYEEDELTIAYKSSCFEYNNEWYSTELEVVIDGVSYPKWFVDECQITGEMIVAVNANENDENDPNKKTCWARFNEIKDSFTIAYTDECEFINGSWYAREMCQYVETESVWVLKTTYASCHNLRGCIDVDGIMTRINMTEMYAVA